MKRTLTAVLTASIALSAGAGVAAAQPYGHDQNRGYDRHDDRYDRHDDRGNGHHNWRRGQRISQDEWHRYQRVDWRRHHLHAPPRGYEWRQTDDGNYVMAAVATGLIASIIANSR